MACTTTSGTSMISRVRPNRDVGMRRLIQAPNGSGMRARISDAGLQDVAPAAHGVQEARLARVGFDLAAQAHAPARRWRARRNRPSRGPRRYPRATALHWACGRARSAAPPPRRSDGSGRWHRAIRRVRYRIPPRRSAPVRPAQPPPQAAVLAAAARGCAAPVRAARTGLPR